MTPLKKYNEIANKIFLLILTSTLPNGPEINSVKHLTQDACLNHWPNTINIYIQVSELLVYYILILK